MASAAAASPSALLLFNGRFVCEALPRVRECSWVVIEGGVFARVGASPEEPPPLDSFADAARRVDLGGRRVLPGLIDAHIHVENLGRALRTVDLRGCRSLDELRARLAARLAGADAPPQGEWLQAHGWEQDELGAWPSRADLDKVSAERPVVAWRVCRHVCVVNSAALRLLGIDRERGDVVGGVVERDAASHEPTGLLKESACDRVASLSIGSDATRRACITRGLRECLQRGITAVQTNDGGAWPLYAALAKEEALPLRVFLTVQAHEVGTPSAPPPGSRVGELLSCHRAKIFADGSLGADTAALSEPYQHLRAGEEEDEEEDGPAAKAPAAKRARSAPRECDHAHAALGVLVHAREPLRALVARTHAAGFRLEVHVIGDRAADEVLGALEAAGAGPAARPILTHCQVLRGDLIARMRALGAVANVQPQFVASDARWVDKKLSAALRPFAYAWRTLLREGVIVAGGSDAPIERADPLEGMHAAVFRFLQGTASPWRPEEALSREEALHIYTVGGALAAQEEARLGRVAPGMAADLVVLGVDAWAEPARLAACSVEQVWVAGRRRL